MKQMTQRLFRISTLTGLMLCLWVAFLPAVANACECPVVPLTVEEDFAQSEYVFIGRAKQVRQENDRDITRFFVERVYKGDIKQLSYQSNRNNRNSNKDGENNDVELQMSLTPWNCDTAFSPDQRYIIFATYSDTDKTDSRGKPIKARTPSASLCSHTAIVESAEETITKLQEMDRLAREQQRYEERSVQ